MPIMPAEFSVLNFLDIAAVAHVNPQGFTMNARTAEFIIEGYAVAYAATQGSHGATGLVDALFHAAGHNGVIGGWLDNESGLYYFDSVRVFPNTTEGLIQAVKFATENDQIAFYDLTHHQEWRRNPDGEGYSIYDPSIHALSGV